MNQACMVIDEEDRLGDAKLELAALAAGGD
jgi:hypothetical protein